MEEMRKGGPLQGLKVLDLTRVLSGPFATKWLASMGADVIKIENPDDPDVTRNYTPQKNGHSAYFPTVNHNKRCITLNLKAEEGKELFRKLAKDADVVIENFRPGVMEKLGLGYEALSQINPGLIYASISGYGTYGPYAQRPGYDVTAQAYSGRPSHPDRFVLRRHHGRPQRSISHPGGAVLPQSDRTGPDGGDLAGGIPDLAEHAGLHKVLRGRRGPRPDGQYLQNLDSLRLL